MKNLYTFLVLAFTVFVGNAQIVTIPDANFKAKLVSASTTTYIALNIGGNMIKIDTNNDGQIQVTEAATVYTLIVQNASIADLTGIQSFTNLRVLRCNNNTLTSLNLINPNLQQLDCYSNSFVSLTINALPALTSLSLYPNPLLQNLTVTNNPLLVTLALGSSSGALPALVNLDLSHNALSTLTGNDSNPMTNLMNVNLSYNNLSGMIGGIPNARVLNFSNNNFSTVNLQSNTITDLNVSNNQLTEVGVYNSPNLVNIDFSGNPLITNLSLTNTKLINLSVSNLNFLQYLNCNFEAWYPGTKLSTLTVSNLPALISLNCSNNNLTNLNINNFPSLVTILADDNPNNNIILSNLPAITELDLDWTANSININTMPNLSSLTFNYSTFNNITVDVLPNLTELHYVQPFVYNQFNISNLPNLATMSFYGHKTSAFNLTIASLPALTSLDLDISNYCNLTLANLPLLYTLEFSTINTINVHDLPALHTLRSTQGNLTSMTLANLPSLFELLLNNNSLTGLVLQNLPALRNVDVESNNITNLVLTNLPNLYDLNLSYNNSSATGVAYNFANLPLLYNLDLRHTNAPATITLNALPNLHDFLFDTNTKITSLSFNNLPNLYICKVSSCSSLTAITFTNLPSLYEFFGYNNEISSISVTNLPNLHDLTLQDNDPLGNDIVLNNLPNLYNLNLEDNNITTLAVTNLPSLYNFSISRNTTLQNFTLTNLPALNRLDITSCIFNLVSLDLSSCPAIQRLIYDNYYYNVLKYINLKNGNSNFTTLTIGASVKTICVDTPAEAALLQSLAPTFNNIIYTTYCTFAPGGTYYTIQGNSRFDANGNGCDASDIPYPIMNFNVLANTVNNNFYANNTTSSYLIPLIAGTYTITPAIENSNYFTISPSSVNLTLPTTTNPVIQDFCVTPNGGHNDLEVMVVPRTSAVPGFDATYKIVYKNKGTTTQSGSVSLNFSDAVLDFVSANPVIASQSSNTLNWNFTSLLPQEARVIEVKLNLNSTVETPPINSGNVLTHTAAITGNVDEMPNDNTSTFNQTVINSFDPNDKTCVEGTTISPAMVGKYVHYVIRFENTGTANAQNVVVKDIIDTTKFDIASLVPMNGSHVFTTRITNTNQVEFIFENINLPFAAGTNGGYLTFKIKTKPTLVVGDTFTNNAGIYFAYNAPILTNTASTVVQLLATTDFDFGNYFSIYPNPAATSLNLETKATIGVKSIDIYNMLGQIIIAIPNAENVTSIDVSDLKTGTYFIKVNTDKGTANSKFVKE